MIGAELFKIDDIQVTFITPRGLLEAVRGVSFSIHEGEVTGIVGESGSGKSVTALSMLGLLPANGRITGGDVLYKGGSVLSYDQRTLRNFRGKEAGIIFQEPGRSFDPIYSIGKTMEEAIRAHNPQMREADVRHKSVSLLSEVHIPRAEERLFNFPHQFSGGMLQRIMIAVSLAADPRVLIADEPTTALDVTIQAQILDLLLELRKKRNLAVVFISHDLALIGSIADRLIVMYAGLVAETGPAEAVLSRSHHPYSRALLDSHPHLGDHYTEKTLATIPGTIPDPHHPEPGCPFEPRCKYARTECRLKVPPLLDAEGTPPGTHQYRCVVKGVKE